MLTALACTPGPAPQRPMPENHSFPIWEGEVHALGKVDCKSCHPPGIATFKEFSCTGCHRHPEDRTNAEHARVSGYVYESRACFDCHPDGRRPGPNASAQSISVTGLIPTFEGTRIVSVTPLEQSIPMTMNHGSAQVPALPCVSCHPDAALRKFYPGQFHASLLAEERPQPTACNDCHGGSSPLGFVGPLATLPLRDPPTGEMRHDAVALDGGAKLVPEDCSVCHVPPSATSAASWQTRASFHAARADAGSPRLSSCLDCHANARPAGELEPLPKVLINHQAPVWLGDCVTCHTPRGWDGGTFHVANPAPATCLPCHAAGRPDAGSSVDVPPFDFGTNARGITHGAGQDCAVCHQVVPGFDGGYYVHDGGVVASSTCVACHTTQRPTAPVNGFDHATSGTGDCFGCHQATSSYDEYPADWAGGQRYPGRFPIASSDALLEVTSFSLRRGGPNDLVTAAVSSRVPLYNAMLHTSAELPPGLDAGDQPGDMTACWHCHTSAPGTQVVTSFLDGRLHASIASFRATPDAGPVALPQPQRCNDCHATMRPPGLVQQTVLRPMDHDARFDGGVTIDGRTVTRVSQLDCATCHGSPDGAWGNGAFHSRIPVAAQAALQDCTVCHYTLMADPQADVISAASPAFNMKHRSSQLTFQKCDRCHGTALANAMGTPVATAWKPGALHASVASQPTACVDCHRPASVPAHPTQSAWSYKGDGQWMNHANAVVAGRDCAFCHSGDVPVTASKWSKSTLLHRPQVAPAGCRGCHGPENGGAANNVPAGLIDTKVTTSASASTGVSGRKVQLAHSDVNVRSRECSFCHSQIGIADAGSPAAGAEWAQATFHSRFTGGDPLQLDGTTGRCSNCHLNLRPQASYPKFDHSGVGEPPNEDCSGCHSWPGTGSAGLPNWRLTASAPSVLNVGGFSIAQPPAPNATTTQAGLTGLAHPGVPAGGSCTTCHASASGGRRAFAYDHALAPATGCSACHEAGSDLVATPWTPGTGMVAANCTRGGGMILSSGGDTRPVGLSSLPCTSAATPQAKLNHFYPSDCGECHRKPTAVPATTKTGADYANGWRFVHSYGAPIQQQTCCGCHAPPSCRG